MAMESTGVYWIPLDELLESEAFEVLLVNAEHVNVQSNRSKPARSKRYSAMCKATVRSRLARSWRTKMAAATAAGGSL